MSRVTGRQIRAARALLGLSAKELARHANVGWATIQRFETSEGIPKSISGTLERVITTLETQGVKFIGDPIRSPGVQLKDGSNTSEKGDC